ncbi:lysophospholipid acyltransferase family protein [bacterium]|nr:lysophospholipid acyltransferase family protein [bacterium]
MIRLTFRLLALVPFRLRSNLGALCGSLIGRILQLSGSRDYLVAKEQLRIFLRADDPDHAALSVFRHFTRIAFECVDLRKAISASADPSHDSKGIIACEDIELVQQLRDSGEPILALTAHFGNWELMAGHICSLGIPVVTVAREARNARLQTLLREQREELGVTTIWRGGKTAQKELITAFREARTVAALIDQDTRVSGAFSPFFGREVITPSALIDLARRTGAQIVTAFCLREPSGSYLVRVTPLSPTLSTEEILSLYHKRLEDVIRSAPEQWVWFHKRWRTLPEGGRLSSKQYLNFLQHDRAQLQP